MTYAFISYSRKDSKYVSSLVSNLSNEGFEFWLDTRINAGADWFDAIEEKILGCGAFIVVMSPYARASQWVKKEIIIADDGGKPIFPLLLEGKRFGIVADKQYEDVRGGRHPQKSFYDGLARVIPRTSAATNALESTVATREWLMLPSPAEFDIYVPPANWIFEEASEQLLEGGEELADTTFTGDAHKLFPQMLLEKRVKNALTDLAAATHNIHPMAIKPKICCDIGLARVYSNKDFLIARVSIADLEEATDSLPHGWKTIEVLERNYAAEWKFEHAESDLPVLFDTSLFLTQAWKHRESKVYYIMAALKLIDINIQFGVDLEDLEVIRFGY